MSLQREMRFNQTYVFNFLIVGPPVGERNSLRPRILYDTKQSSP